MIIQLMQECHITSYGHKDEFYGQKTKTAYEPVFVSSDHIEYFFSMGTTKIKMASGDEITVREAPELIYRKIRYGDNES